MLSSDGTAPSSTPQRDDAVFSDGARRASSPPSSPPGFPWEQQQARQEEPRSPLQPAMSAFSLLGKRKALSSVSDNARPVKRAAKASTKPDSKPLTQMQISLGQKVQQKCKACGMEYVASSAEDRKLHEKYHKQNAEGYDVGKDFVQKARNYTVFKGANSADSICAIDCFDRPARKRRAQAALEIAQRELGAVPIPEKEIWDFIASCEARACEPKFRAYLYLRGSKCVGFLLTELITEARHVLEPERPRSRHAESVVKGSGARSLLKARKQAAEEAAREAASQPIRLSDKSHPARLGISRIWTSPHHRHQDIATTLLNTAVTHHGQRAERDDQAYRERAARPSELDPVTKAYMDELLKPLERLKGKEDVAFSQPTEAGARLARRWFGKLYGWSVYVD